ncbi:MAG: hypothetical protein K5866_01935 [Treponema sp.]|nr:hypothetical protein [Treponema sp.]
MSGKKARKLRKSKKISKISIAALTGLCIAAAPLSAGGEVLLGLYPHVTFPVLKFDDSLKTGFGGGLELTYRPFTYFDLSLLGDYQYYLFDTSDSVGSLSLFSGGLGAAYHLPLSDRLSLNIGADVQAYKAKYQKSEDDYYNLPGVKAGATLSLSYKINPSVAVSSKAGASHYKAGNTGLITGLDVQPGITFNFTKAFMRPKNLDMSMNALEPVFPVLYSWYDNNSFGSVSIQNKEDATITDVKVSFFQPQYMGQPQECGSVESLKRGESLDVNLKAFFNEQMLELIERTECQASVIVEYKYLGQKREQSFAMLVPVYGRNNMSWADDRCASVFVSSKDPAAMWFAKYITSVVRDNVRSGVALNIQYAMGIFEALDQFGLNYVIDPTSAFADNVGTASIDFLQFPYQTLMYRGGDCDDLSILVCSLFEAIGIKTAFITIPGHIFMAFDSGLTIDQAKNEFLSLDELILDYDNNEVWVPLEITLTDEGFNKAWKVGAREWNQSDKDGTAMLYKMEDSWKIYKPVNVPGASSHFTLPDEKLVGKLFSHSVDEYILKQITPQVVAFESKLKNNQSPELYNDFGVLYARYGLFKKAEAQFRVARRQDYLPAILNTANLFYSMKDFGRAQKWYEEVLTRDEDNILAILGVARCAYEIGNYDVCDKYFEIVYNTNPQLAAEFAYLSAFESSQGRSFTLADRLMNTTWLESNDKLPQNNQALAVKDSLTSESDTLLTVDSANPVDDLELPDFNQALAVLAPDSANKRFDDDDDFPPDDGPDGDGPDPDDDITFDEPLQVEKSYKGILSQLEFEVLSTEEIQAIAEKTFEENPDLIKTPLLQADAPEKIAQLEEDKSFEEKLDSAVQNAESFVYPEEVIQVADLTLNTENPTEKANLENAESFVYPEEVIDIGDLTLSDKTQGIATAQPTLEPIATPTQEIAAAQPTVEPIATPSQEIAVVEQTVEETATTTQEIAAAQPDFQDSDFLAEELTTEESTDIEFKVADTGLSQTPMLSKPEEEIKDRAVPRFTKQPSEEWAPQEAYTAESIPGMRSFEEEMGEYQNEKAFLYQDELDFALNPEEDTEEHDQELQVSEQIAMADLPVVNPFSSFLSEEAAQKVEEITNYSLEKEEAKAEEEKSIILASVKETEPAEKAATSVNTAAPANSSAATENTAATVNTAAPANLSAATGNTAAATVNTAAPANSSAATVKTTAPADSASVDKNLALADKAESENKATQSTNDSDLIESKNTENKTNTESLVKNTIKNAQKSEGESKVKEAKSKKITLISILVGVVAGAVLAFSASKKTKKKAKTIEGEKDE